MCSECIASGLILYLCSECVECLECVVSVECIVSV